MSSMHIKVLIRYRVLIYVKLSSRSLSDITSFGAYMLLVTSMFTGGTLMANEEDQQRTATKQHHSRVLLPRHLFWNRGLMPQRHTVAPRRQTHQRPSTQVLDCLGQLASVNSPSFSFYNSRLCYQEQFRSSICQTHILGEVMLNFKWKL